LYNIWADTEQEGLKFKFATSGDLQDFGDEWSDWEEQVAILWAYYRVLAVSRGQSEVSLVISVEESVWRFVLSGDGGVCVTCTSGNEV